MTRTILGYPWLPVLRPTMEWLLKVRRLGSRTNLLSALAIVLSARASIAQNARASPPIEPVAVQRKMALVIGNSAYPTSPLKNPGNDAIAIAAALQRLGFQVTVANDLTRRRMDEITGQFASHLRAGDMALFFYSGHGAQMEQENYLIPVDFQATSPSDIRYNAIAASQIRDRLEDSGARLRIMILDACRANPFLAARGGPMGLAAMTSRVEGTLIAYATADNGLASDNSSESNGLYSKYLLQALQTPGLTLKQVFDRVRDNVWAQSGRRQRPYTYDGIVGDLPFTSAEAALAVAAPLLEPATPPATFITASNQGAAISIIHSVSAIRMTSEFARAAAAAQAGVDQVQSRIIQDLGGRMLGVVDKLAREARVDLVLDISDPRTSVLWMTSGIDITDASVSRYDSAYGGAPGASNRPIAVARGPVAAIHLQTAILGTKDGQNAERDIQTRFASQAAALEKKQAGLSTLQYNLSTQGAGMTEEGRQNLTRQIDQATSEITRETATVQAQVDHFREKLVTDLRGKMIAVIGRFAAATGSVAVVDMSNPQLQAVYVADSIDITEDVIAAYEATQAGRTPSFRPRPPSKLAICAVNRIVGSSNQAERARLASALSTYASSNGYLMVLDVGDPRTPVLWASPGIDITAGLEAVFSATPAR
jgi:uncharacterized caspase-like protein